MITIKEKLDAHIRSAEQQVAVLRGKRALLQRECPQLMDVEVPRVMVCAHDDLAITIYDRAHTLPALPTLFSKYAISTITKKQTYDNNRMEYFSFDVAAGITIDLDRFLLITKKCRKARVQRVIEICGEPDDETEVIEWLTD